MLCPLVLLTLIGALAMPIVLLLGGGFPPSYVQDSRDYYEAGDYKDDTPGATTRAHRSLWAAVSLPFAVVLLVSICCVCWCAVRTDLFIFIVRFYVRLYPLLIRR